jgi:D-alanine transfer protein
VLPSGLVAAAAAGLLFLGAAKGLTRLADREVAAHIDRIAPLVLDEKTGGVRLQVEAFRRDDVLPVYGSSELVWESEHRASEFFAPFPTGFAVSPVGDRGTPPLITFQQLAAVGEELRGRKVVVILSPEGFASPLRREPEVLAGNYSRLQAGVLFFAADIDPDLKGRAARQLLAFPNLLTGDPFLRTELEALASPGRLGRMVDRVLRPFGHLQNVFMKLSDDATVLWRLLRQADLRAPAVRRASVPDWATLAAEADAEYRRSVEGNPLGFENARQGQRAMRPRRNDGAAERRFLELLRDSPRWESLELILGLLRSRGARALVVSLPFHGPFLEQMGVSAGARKAYYARLGTLAAEYGVPCRTFEEFEDDPYFLRDTVHPTPRGWVLLDRILDAFYHDATL